MLVLSLNLNKGRFLPKGKTTRVATKLLGATKYAGTSEVPQQHPCSWVVGVSKLAHLNGSHISTKFIKPVDCLLNSFCKIHNI